MFHSLSVFNFLIRPGGQHSTNAAPCHLAAHKDL
jgi:hypothetical protein